MSFALTPALLAEVGAVASVGGAALGATGAIQSSRASAESAKYNSQVASENATIAKQNATWAAEAGEEQAAQSEMKTRAQVGGIIANQAASGLDVGSGTATDVQSSAKELGELDAINIRANAARQAYGYDVQAQSDVAQSQLDKFQAEQDIAGGALSAGADVISGTGNAAFNYGRYLQGGNGNYLTTVGQ